MGNISSNPDDWIVLTEIGSYLWFQDLQHAKTVSKLLSVVFNGQISDAAMFRNLLKVFGSTDKFSPRINFNSGYILNRRFVDFPTGSVEWKCLHSSLQSSQRQYLFSSSKHFPTLPIKNQKITLNQNGMRTNMWPSSTLKTDSSEQLVIQSKAPFHKLVSTVKGETTTSTLSCIAYFEVSFTQNSNNSGYSGDNRNTQPVPYHQLQGSQKQQHFSFPPQHQQQPFISIGICSPVGPSNNNITNNNNTNNNNGNSNNTNSAVNLDHSFIYHSNGHTQYIPQHSSASTSPHFVLPPTTYSPSDVIGCGIVYPPLCQNGAGQVIFTANGRVVEVINLGDKYTLCVPFFPIMVTNDEHLTPVLNFGTSSPLSFDILSYELQLIQKLFGGSESWDIYESIVLDQDRKYRANLHPLYFHPYNLSHNTTTAHNANNITNNVTNNCSSSNIADTGADGMIESDSNNEAPVAMRIASEPSLFFNMRFQLQCSGLLQQIEQKREDDEVDVSSDSSGADCSSGSDHSQLDYDYDDPISGTYGAYSNACVDDYCNSSDEEQQLTQQLDNYISSNINTNAITSTNNSSFIQNSTEKPAFRRRKARKFASIMPFDDTTPPNTVENSTFGSGFSANGLFSSAAPSDTECDMAVDFESWSLDKPLGGMLSSNSYPTLQSRNGLSEQAAVTNAGTTNNIHIPNINSSSNISSSNSNSSSMNNSVINRPHSKSLDYASLADVKRSNTNSITNHLNNFNTNSIYNNSNVNNSNVNNSNFNNGNLNSAISCGYHPDNEDNIEGDDDSVAASLCVEVESVNEEDGTYLNFGADCPYSYDDELLQLHPFNSTTSGGVSSMDNGGYLYTDLLLHGSPQLTAMENSSNDHISHKRKRKGRMASTATNTNNTSNANATSSGNNSATGYNSSRPSSSETVPPVGQMETDEAHTAGSTWNISHGSHLGGGNSHNSGTVSSPPRTVVQLRHFKGKLQDQTELQSDSHNNNNGNSNNNINNSNNNNSNNRNNLTAATSGNNARNIRSGIQRGLSY